MKLHAVNRVNQRQRKTCVQYRTETTVLISSTKSNIQLHCDIITVNRDSFDALVYSQIHYISARRIFVPKRISSYNDKHVNSHIVFTRIQTSYRYYNDYYVLIEITNNI